MVGRATADALADCACRWPDVRRRRVHLWRGLGPGGGSRSAERGRCAPLAAAVSPPLEQAVMPGLHASLGRLSQRWDAIVIGAGPAGSLVARQLALGQRRVLLVDKKRFP